MIVLGVISILASYVILMTLVVMSASNPNLTVSGWVSGIMGGCCFSGLILMLLGKIRQRNELE